MPRVHFVKRNQCGAPEPLGHLAIGVAPIVPFGLAQPLFQPIAQVHPHQIIEIFALQFDRLPGNTVIDSKGPVVTCQVRLDRSPQHRSVEIRQPLGPIAN